jgi:hypothetical protein
MKNIISRLFIVSAAFLASIGAASAEERPLLEEGRELLILRNGQIFEGRIEKIKDQYLVDASDSQVKVRAADVEFVCRSLEEAYLRKRAVIQDGNWRDHLELARWCQKHEMLKPARDELAAAEAISPNNPLADMLRRQMETAEEPAEKPEKKFFREEISNEELDHMVRGLPPGTVELYTQIVQPVLMNNCTASGCHGQQSQTAFRLYRTSTGEQANRRLTQRNLYNVLRYIDRENPAESPLLIVPSKPHGTAKTAIFSEHRAGQFGRMVEWAVELGPADYSMPDEIDAPPRLLSREAMQAKPLAATRKNHARPIPVAEPDSDEVQPASYQEPPAEFLQSSGQTKTAKTPKQSPKPPIEGKIKRGAPIPKNEPKDAFDPDVFNRRYHKQDNPSEGGDSSPEANPIEKRPQ